MEDRPYLADISLVITTLLWGYGFITTKLAVGYVTASQLLFYRFLVSSIILTAIFWKKLKKIDKRDVFNCVLVGFFLYMGFLLQTIAINYTTVAKNAFLTTLNVIIVPIIVSIVNKEKIDKYSKIGCVMAIIGAAVLSLNLDFSFNYGDFLSILCSIFFSCHIFFQGNIVRYTRLPIIVTGQVIVACALSFITIILKGEGFVTNIDFIGAGSILYLAIISTCVCFFMQAYCQRYTSATKTVVIFSLEAVFASIFAVLIFGDKITLRFLLGGSCILCAVIVSTTKLAFMRKRNLTEK